MTHLSEDNVSLSWLKSEIPRIAESTFIKIPPPQTSAVLISHTCCLTDVAAPLLLPAESFHTC